jgi:hypothetical protein
MKFDKSRTCYLKVILKKLASLESSAKAADAISSYGDIVGMVIIKER